MTRPKGSKNKIRTESGEPETESFGPETVKPDVAPRLPSGPKVNPGVKWAKAAQVQETLTGTLQTLGLGVGFVNQIDGVLIYDGAEKVSAALVDLARLDPRYRKMIEGASAPGKYGPLIVAVSPIVMGIMTNHALSGVEKKIKQAAKTPSSAPIFNLAEAETAAHATTDIPDISSDTLVPEGFLDSESILLDP